MLLADDALTIQRLSEQASQLQAAFSAANAEAAAAGQHAQQQQLQAVIADRNAAYGHAKVTSHATHTLLTLCLQQHDAFMCAAYALCIVNVVKIVCDQLVEFSCWHVSMQWLPRLKSLL